MSDARKPPGGRPPTFDDLEEEITSVGKLPAIESRSKAPAPIRDRATFTVVSGPSAGPIHSLVALENVIGRGKECSVRILDSGISRRHARVLRQGPGKHAIEDLRPTKRTPAG